MGAGLDPQTGERSRPVSGVAAELLITARGAGRTMVAREGAIRGPGGCRPVGRGGRAMAGEPTGTTGREGGETAKGGPAGACTGSGQLASGAQQKPGRPGLTGGAELPVGGDAHGGTLKCTRIAQGRTRRTSGEVARRFCKEPDWDRVLS